MMAKLVTLIEESHSIGKGVLGDPIRPITSYWTQDGQLVFQKEGKLPIDTPKSEPYVQQPRDYREEIERFQKEQEATRSRIVDAYARLNHIVNEKINRDPTYIELRTRYHNLHEEMQHLNTERERRCRAIRSERERSRVFNSYTRITELISLSGSMHDAAKAYRDVLMRRFAKEMGMDPSKFCWEAGEDKL